ncbi:MAG: PTS sugar transporter subunit IIA [Cocleimonas sp.]
MTDRQLPILNTERIQFIKKSVSKKQIFDLLTKLLADGQSEVSSNTIFDTLISREKLGNTSIGNEIAIPRSHVDIINPRAALLVLKNPLKTTDTVDKKGIRFFLALLIPETSKGSYSDVVIKINQTLAKGNKLDTLASSKNPELLADYINSLLSLNLNKESKQ